MRRTKIVCTIGPATSSKEMIRKLAEAGMNVARLNFSHGTHADHKKVIEYVKEVREELGIPLAIMLDTKGAEIRTAVADALAVRTGQVVKVAIKPAFVTDQLRKGMSVLIDDGYIQGTVLGGQGGIVEIQVLNDGVIKKQKSVVFPGETIQLPDLTEQDVHDIRFGCKEGVEIIAASFVNTAKQLLAMKDILAEEGRSNILIIAKIESRQGVDNFDAILQVADGIMVARGDLGLEFPVSLVPPLQKKMTASSNHMAKPVIIATQMLESMIHNPSPTRAEASDVANAIYDAASAVMLSGETAMGAYPIQAVQMMHDIIIEAEKDFNYFEFFKRERSYQPGDIPTAVAVAAVNISYQINATALLVHSFGGNTVRRIASRHPKALILSITPSIDTYHQMALMWGTLAIKEKVAEIEKGLEDIICYALRKGWVKYGDPIVVTLGKPYGVSFTTNTLRVDSVGGVIVRGLPMEKAKHKVVEGDIHMVLSYEAHKGESFSGKIIITTRIPEKTLPQLKEAKGIILQNHPHDTESERLLRTLDLPYITRADAATSLLKEGEKVRLFPASGLVFKADSPSEEEMMGKH